MTSTARPRVAALMPAWQAEDFVAEGLEALLAQTWPDLQIIVSVDLSTDGTADICRKYADRHPNLRVIVQTERQGWIANTNALLAAADTDYLMFCGHDDLIAPTYVEALVTALEARPDAALAYSDMLTTGDGEDRITQYADLDGLASAQARARRLLRRKGEWYAAYRGVFRAAAARQINGLKRHPAGEFAADWPWLLALSLRGAFVRVPEALCTKRFQTGSLSKQWRHSFRDWIGASDACRREIRASPLDQRAKRNLVAFSYRLNTFAALDAVARRFTGRPPPYR